MSPTTFTRYQCWQVDRISTVINKDAVAVDRATFLATHTPFNTLVYRRTPASIPSTNEAELLRELHGRSRQDQHTFVAVQGMPGSGKSHLIRWLKIRYETANNPNEVVLLIERANNSLRQTLLQIIDSGVFEGEAFVVQQKKLERATRQLSEEGLEETLINNLHVAHKSEVKVAADKRLPNSIAKRLHFFLLDPFVREELRREDGPVKRLARFLSGTQTRLENDEIPSFRPEDFEFSLETRTHVKNEGYNDARVLLDHLYAQTSLRQQLATYLNQLLEFAISQTTALTGDDLKNMFHDLRRELRKQGRALVLFIEDVTAFTGLDAGLIDVLVTQHTGETNSHFCRLISVIGITDDFYATRFPDNLRERITHHLTLNATGQNQQEALLLSSDETISPMAARYLNAMRMDDQALQIWFKADAKAEDLPNACTNCRFQQTCHAAFGAVTIEENGVTQQVGLYPFNEQALLTMYRQIDVQKISRTPRSLLNSVIEFVLLTHSPRIRSGTFPAPRIQMGQAFTAPSLPLLQTNLLREMQVPEPERERIESLVVFWGNRTLETTSDANGQPLVGGLSQAVFEAFNLPFPSTQIAQTLVIEGVKGKAEEVTSPPSPHPTPPPEVDPTLDDIARWRDGGLLDRHERLVPLLTNFIAEGIDWESHRVLPVLVEERIRLRYFAIEGQSGKASSASAYLLPRSDELAYVLEALHNLQQRRGMSPEEIGAYTLTLSYWLEGQEESIVAFVREPHLNHSVPMPLTKLLVEDALCLACLSGDLTSSDTDPETLFTALISSCRSEEIWAHSIAAATNAKRASAWVELMRRYQAHSSDSSVTFIRQQLLQSVNRSQGTSTDVRFIDACTLLETLEQALANDWSLSSFDSSLPVEGQTWQAVKKVHRGLVEHFQSSLSAEQIRINHLAQQLTTFVGDCTALEVQEAINQALQVCHQAQIPFLSFLLQWQIAELFDRRRQDLADISSLSTITKLAPALSSAAQLTTATEQDVKYLQGITSFLKDTKNTLTKEIETGRGAVGTAANLVAQVEQQFAITRERLSTLIAGETEL